jgi:hypothetical protein
MAGRRAVIIAARGARELGPAGRLVKDRANDEVEGPAKGRADAVGSVQGFSLKHSSASWTYP